MTYKTTDQDVCDLFDTTNKTIAQVARHFQLSVQEVKNILLKPPVTPYTSNG